MSPNGCFEMTWGREGSDIFYLLLFILLLCEQGKQPELCNSSIIKPRDVIHCLSLRCIYMSISYSQYVMYIMFTFY